MFYKIIFDIEFIKLGIFYKLLYLPANSEIKRNRGNL
jgi:hypothetical protein